jgi:hypothetical protein
MLVDCQTCPVRDVHCAECVVTALNTLTTIPVLGPDGPPEQTLGVVGRAGRPAAADADGTVPLDRAERRAVSALLAAGLVTTAAANSARARLDEELPARRAGGARRAV